jgi:D-glycero-D-manno-heptose 1,7-bisphosphate phosphatase
LARPRFITLDRDGTLLVKHEYLSHPDQVALLPRVGGGLRKLRALGCGLVVITNQSGIGRGLFDRARVDEIHGRMAALLADEGVRLDGIYVCPHLPDEGCACRKPRTGLLEQAGRELSFDPRLGFVVGDNECDVELGRAVGAITFLVRSGHGQSVLAKGRVSPDYAVEDVAEAANRIGELLGRSG